MQKIAKICFCLKLTLWQLKKVFKDLFSGFESQDNTQIEYIYIGQYANVSKKYYNKVIKQTKMRNFF